MLSLPCCDKVLTVFTNPSKGDAILYQRIEEIKKKIIINGLPIYQTNWAVLQLLFFTDADC